MYQRGNPFELFEVLRKNICRALMIMVNFCMERDYFAAMDHYIKLEYFLGLFLIFFQTWIELSIECKTHWLIG
ncbi:hypothetical protein LINGRAHAP2_LOCUS1985 [Linum grandiflorum]